MADIHPLETLLLRGWGWKQEPPITTPAALGRALGISTQTLYNWFKGANKPEVARLSRIASRTNIPLRDLLVAAGYPVPPDPDRAFDVVMDQVRHASDIAEAERALLLHQLERLRQKYEGSAKMALIAS